MRVGSKRKTCVNIGLRHHVGLKNVYTTTRSNLNISKKKKIGYANGLHEHTNLKVFTRDELVRSNEPSRSSPDSSVFSGTNFVDDSSRPRKIDDQNDRREGRRPSST